MDEIMHWCNISNHLSKFDGEAANYFSMYYMQRCKQLSTDIQLPKKNFGPMVLCSHCGALWSKNEFKIRISPGKACSKSVKKIIRSCSNLTVLSKFRETLMKKSLKNTTNKIVITCSVCNKKTVIPCKKPERLKQQIEETNKADTSIKKRKKKKKVKDKTAGLNISHINSPAVDKKIISTNTTPKVIKKKPKEKLLTPLQKVRKFNLDKLNMLLNKKETEKKRKSIGNFLKELY